MGGYESKRYRANLAAVNDALAARQGEADTRPRAEADDDDDATAEHWTDGLGPAELAAAVESGRIGGR